MIAKAMLLLILMGCPSLHDESPSTLQMDSSALAPARRLIVQGLQAGVYPTPPFKGSNPDTVKFFIKIFTREISNGRELSAVGAGRHNRSEAGAQRGDEV